MAARFASYANLAFTFELNTYDFDGKAFVAVEVQEFADIPILRATDKGFVARARAAGLDLTGSTTGASDEERFARQLRDTEGA